MNILKSILIGLFIISLMGCKEEFDKVSVFNEYASFIEYSPHSKNIKRQIITYKENGIENQVSIIKADEKGRVIYYSDKINKMSLLNSIISVDYEQLTFNYKAPFLGINVNNGNIFLDKTKSIQKMVGVTGGKYSMENHYNDGKLISTFWESAFLSSKNEFYWENNSITKYISEIKKLTGESFISIESVISYNSDGQLQGMKSSMTVMGMPMELIVTFQKINNYGDWTEAELVSSINSENSKEKKVETVTREIEYW
ncbi:hypothetical protein J3U16_09650 [Gilliamella sp. B3023]|uniref:hypothetical protein n=1 Tax=unclassified Gilliamella TaxID=2685620 RepID=UPI002269829F|nr:MULTISPECIES: hypothetical protein [unclassified Gilliamella]MCX8584635.1 hypothetical protein [Gilliamella sp. B3562]MCX8675555.1 hypothetical protein [Gilliamella sp. B3023]MCX8684282.1 hypothetical protein [Gilliamella sp. B2864]